MHLVKKNIEQSLFDERYEILETLSCPADSVVYRAMHINSADAKSVVLKVFYFKENNREELIERAKKEALVLYNIQNGDAPTLLDYVQTEECCYLVLENTAPFNWQFARLAKPISLHDQRPIEAKTFENKAKAAETHKPKLRTRKIGFYAVSAICALLLITFVKTILQETSPAEAVIQKKFIEQPEVVKENFLQLSPKEQLISDLSEQAQEIKNIEKQLEKNPNVIYKSQASSITEEQLKRLSLKQLASLKELRAKRIELLSKKLENVLDSSSL